MSLFCEEIEWCAGGEVRGQRRFHVALIGSLLLHCTLAGLVSALAVQKTGVQEPVMIDLTTASFPAAEQEQHAATPLHRSQRSATRPVVPQQSVAAVQAVIQSPVPASASPLVADQKSVAADNAGQSAAVTGSSGGVVKGAAATETGSVSAGTAPLDTVETLQKRYLREHFAYIRDLIGKELRYPRQALRMGWNGRVNVSFLVLVDGSVAELRVARASGCPLLDNNALETVRKAAPFPKPPVSARLLIPVDYVLE